jgi:hypothetical protein
MSRDIPDDRTLISGSVVVVFGGLFESTDFAAVYGV